MADPLWTADEIAAATGGTATAPFAATGVSIDTRTLDAGDLFVGLAGARDGAAFVDEAARKGAAGALVGGLGGSTSALPGIVVEDALAALARLGVAARERASNARRCAITGSVGKTSVTQALSAALAAAGPSHSSVLSYNNHIGVPLTLARMPRATRYAAFEMGMNHSEEIRPLSRMVRPHVAVVTTVGGAHVENFVDGDRGVAHAKAEIFDGLEPSGVAVLNADNEWFDLLSQTAKAAGARVFSFGRGPTCDARLIDFQSHPAGSTVTASFLGRTLRFEIAQTGSHWGLNSLAVLLAVEALGAPLEPAMQALERFEPLAGRGRSHRLKIGGVAMTLVDESYNANPVSMRAVLAALGDMNAAGRKIVVLTDMLEMGQDAPTLHAALAEPLAAAGVDLVFAAGPMMRSLFDVLPDGVRGAWRPTAEALTPLLLEALKPGDVVAVKGSKGSRASVVVDAVLAVGRPIAASLDAGAL